MAKYDVDLSIKFVRTVKFTKIILAVLVVGAYFYKPQYLTELVVLRYSCNFVTASRILRTYTWID